MNDVYETTPVTISPEKLTVQSEVASALRAGRPVVALESTVIAHGLPRPGNLELARSMERIVRDGGAIPATIAVIDGTVHIGLDDTLIDRLGTGDDVRKLSTRDLGPALARGWTGGTTVAATSHLAIASGIRTFATGGIGGVHGGHLPDVSADLFQLQRTPIICVCAGAKSILDLAATREYLETLGVLVLGWETDEFPGFYYRTTGLGVDLAVDTAEEVVGIHRSKELVGDSAATLVCVPVPEHASLEPAEVEEVLAVATAEADRLAIAGKDLTPYLLKSLVTHTGGRSLESNVALLENNAAIAARIAVAGSRT